jgi:hypothetical protein
VTCLLHCRHGTPTVMEGIFATRDHATKSRDVRDDD